MSEQFDTTAVSANLSRIMPVCKGFTDSKKLNPASKRLLPVVEFNEANKRHKRGRRSIMLVCHLNKGYKLSPDNEDFLTRQLLARDLDVSLATQKSTFGTSGVLAELDDWQHFIRLALQKA